MIPYNISEIHMILYCMRYTMNIEYNACPVVFISTPKPL